MRVCIYSSLPVAGAPFQQFQCLKKYTNLDVRYVVQKDKYNDGRVFPHDLFLTDEEGQEYLRSADVVHLHNDLPLHVEKMLTKSRQKIIATLHSSPPSPMWNHMRSYAHKAVVIRQPLQMRGHPSLGTLPNLFDIWDSMPLEGKTYTDAIGVVYCPTNRLPPTRIGSKGYATVLPLLRTLEKKYKKDVFLIHHTAVEYTKNLHLKRQGHICIDDVISSTFHLTSIEGLCTGQAVLTSVASDNYPFVYTTPLTLTNNIESLLAQRSVLESHAQKNRQWVEDHWNPVDMVNEYLALYNTV